MRATCGTLHFRRKLLPPAYELEIKQPNLAYELERKHPNHAYELERKHPNPAYELERKRPNLAYELERLSYFCAVKETRYVYTRFNTAVAAMAGEFSPQTACTQRSTAGGEDHVGATIWRGI